MKKKHFCIAVILITLVISCKKKSDDPQPSSTGGAYLLTKQLKKDMSGNFLLTTTDYTYDTSGRLLVKKITDNNFNNISYQEVNSYNGQGLMVMQYVKSRTGNSPFTYMSYTFTYDANNLVKIRTRYSDTTATTQNQTTNYTYDLNNQLSNMVVATNVNKDSTSYSNYSNGRPGVEQSFASYSGIYSIFYTRKYTYDSRLNRINTEITRYSPFTYVYNLEDNEYNNSVMLAVEGTQNVNPSGEGDINIGSTKNIDNNLRTHSTSYLSGCESKSNEITLDIQSFNAGGLPLQYKFKQLINNACNTSPNTYDYSYTSTYVKR
jgi:hypothetical protein